MMGTRIRAAGITLVGVLLCSSATAEVMEWTLFLKIGDKNVEYTSEQLVAMATEKHAGQRGTKKNPAVPVDVLVTKDSGMDLDRILKVVLVGESKIMLLEGDQLKHLPKLWLKLGPNNITILPADDETYEALRGPGLFGRPRLKNVSRIYVYERR